MFVFQPVQIAYAVGDLHAAVHHWESRGVGPFVLREHIEVDNARVFGEPGVFDHSSAYGQWGELMVELIHQHNPGEVPVVGTSGVHHVATFVDDFEEAHAALIEAGHEEVMYAEAGGMPFAFMDARKEMGHHLEIYEGTDRLRAFFAQIKALKTA